MGTQMVEEMETFRGKRCPKCSSFIKDDKSKCEICGFAPEEKKKDEQVGIHPVICPRCNAENQADFNFCKICKHPLEVKTVIAGDKEPSISFEETKTTEHTPLSKIILEFQWAITPPDQVGENMIRLIDFHPLFTGYGKWKNYAFFVYGYSNSYEVLVRRINEMDQSMLYHRCENIVLLKSGSVFCLGQLDFQLTENVNHSNKTAVIGPGSVPHHTNKSKRGLRITNMSAEKEFVEINEKCRMGRDWISQQFGLDREMLRMSGVSKEQIRITPLEHGKWQLEPMNSKNIYLAIDEVPVLVEEGEALRWVSRNQYGEFQLKIKNIISHEVTQRNTKKRK
jgi:hypothetical protein